MNLFFILITSVLCKLYEELDPNLVMTSNKKVNKIDVKCIGDHCNKKIKKQTKNKRRHQKSNNKVIKKQSKLKKKRHAKKSKKYNVHIPNSFLPYNTMGPIININQIPPLPNKPLNLPPPPTQPKINYSTLKPFIPPQVHNNLIKNKQESIIPSIVIDHHPSISSINYNYYPTITNIQQSLTSSPNLGVKTTSQLTSNKNKNIYTIMKPNGSNTINSIINPTKIMIQQTSPNLVIKKQISSIQSHSSLPTLSKPKITVTTPSTKPKIDINPVYNKPNEVVNPLSSKLSTFNSTSSHNIQDQVKNQTVISPKKDLELEQVDFGSGIKGVPKTALAAEE